MSIRKIIDWAIQDASNQMTGVIASNFYQFEDLQGSWTWACDVDLGEQYGVLRCVPIAANNREIFYAQQGKSVTLSRVNGTKWVITGLAKVSNSTTHYIFMAFGEDTYSVTRTRLKGDVIRPLTYGELGTLVAPFGYGILPYGAQGKFDAEGAFIEIVEN